MSKRRLGRASGELKIEQYIPVESPELKAERDALKLRVSELEARPPEVRERVVEKTVEKLVDNPELLKKLNATLHENAQLKRFQPAPKIIEKVVEKPVEKIEYIERIKEVINVKLVAGASFGSFLLGLGLGHWF